jgi:hypothetical protein
MRTPPPLHSRLFADYLKRITIGLKGVDHAVKQEILAEIASHIEERVAQLEQQGSKRPLDDALSAFGDPGALSFQFVEEMKGTSMKKGRSTAKKFLVSKQRSAYRAGPPRDGKNVVGQH